MADQVGPCTRAVLAAIKASPLTPNELCAKAGIDRTAMFRFLKGERSITLPTLDKLAPILGLKLTRNPKAPTERD